MIRSVSPEHTADVMTIQSIVTRLMNLSDAGDVDEYMEYYAEDATWTKPASGQHLVGHAAIRESREHMRQNRIDHGGQDSFHLVTNVLVDIAADGNHAECNSYLFVLRQLATTPAIGVVARFQDQFRRMPTGWQISSRVVHEHR